MIDITKHSFLKYFLFGSLYFSEGIEIALATVIIPIYLHVEKGLSIPLTTLIAGLVMFPWMLKFIWGGITDYFIKAGRKRFIIFGGLLGAFSFFILIFIDPIVAIIPFVFFLFLSHVGVGFLDVSADAWAIELSEEQERGKINSAMFSGLFIGMAIGAALLSYIAQEFGYNIAFLITGIIVILIILYPLSVKDERIVKKRPKMGSLLYSEFKKKTTQLVTIFVPLLLISIGLLTFAIPLYMTDSLQLKVSEIGLIISLFPIATIIGALVSGPATDIWGRKKPIAFFAIASAIFTASLIFANTWLILAIIFSTIGFLRGGYYVGINALLMDITNPKVAATQFSILTSIGNFGELFGGMIGGTLIALLGFQRVFLYAALFFGPALIILYLIRIKRTKEKKLST
jgi:PAT family beta-lactamase induction signal transducer AmpG